MCLCQQKMNSTDIFFDILKELINSFQTSGNEFWYNSLVLKQFSRYRQNSKSSPYHLNYWASNQKPNKNRVKMINILLLLLALLSNLNCILYPYIYLFENVSLKFNKFSVTQGPIWIIVGLDCNLRTFALDKFHEIVLLKFLFPFFIVF